MLSACNEWYRYWFTSRLQTSYVCILIPITIRDHEKHSDFHSERPDQSSLRSRFQSGESLSRTDSFSSRLRFCDRQALELYRQRHHCQTNITTMDSTQVKAAVIKQVQQEANLVNARTLIEVRPFRDSLPSNQD